MPAKHIPWSEAERTILRQMWADGAEPVEIGRRLGRSKDSVRRQTKTLQLPRQRPQPDIESPPEPRQPRPQPLPRGAHTLPPLPSEASEHPT
jgi:hypothetical protein